MDKLNGFYKGLLASTYVIFDTYYNFYQDEGGY